MTEQFMKEVDKMLDGIAPDVGVIAKFKGSVRGRCGDLMVMAEIANRAVERKKSNGPTKQTSKTSK